MSGSIVNSRGIHVAVVRGSEIFDLTGKKLCDVKGVNIYRPSGALVGHLSDTRGTEKRLNRSSDRLFSGAYLRGKAGAKPKHLIYELLTFQRRHDVREANVRRAYFSL